MRRTLVLAALLAAVAAQNIAGSTWKETFDFYPCHYVDPKERMPNTLENLVAILENYEAGSGYTNMDEVAEMIIHRYRTDGITYAPNSINQPWAINEDVESDKQDLLKKIVRQTKQFPPNSFEWREECALHMLVSHSTDTFPHAGINANWDGTIPRTNRGDRNKRALGSQSSSYSEDVNSYGVDGNDQNSRRFNDVNYGEADHPLENGVMETPYGPLATGTLLTGIMAMKDTAEYDVGSMITDTSNLPQEMIRKRISPVYAASLAGDIAQMALVDDNTLTGSSVGPAGRYHNCTTCAQQFSLENKQYSHLSRAELYAGIDVLIIKDAFDNNSGGSVLSSLPLSQLLRMYYSEKGLPGKPEYKACNRMDIYKTFDKTKLNEQSLNFMYAYQEYFKSLHSLVEINQDNFPAIEAKFRALLNPAVRAVDTFVASFNPGYEEGYGQCMHTSISNPNGQNTNKDYSPPSEATVELVAVYASQGSADFMRDQRQMIADVARRIGVSNARSSLGIVDASTAGWILPIGNMTNIGDFACNFTDGATPWGSVGSSGSRGDSMLMVLETLAKHYQQRYREYLQDMETSSNRSLVVLWQVPGSMTGDTEANLVNLNDFRYRYPDVSIVFVGRNTDPYRPLMLDTDDFISSTNLDIPTVVNKAVARIYTTPKFFTYPACDPNNSTLASNYREESHLYEGAVSPNYTTYIRIPAQQFQYSEELTIRVAGNVRSCFSRINRLALEDYLVERENGYVDKYIQPNDDPFVCIGGPLDTNPDSATFTRLCDRYVEYCNPLFISITGLSTSFGKSCTSGSNKVNICEYPDQIKYEVTHTGMVCGCSGLAPLMMMVLMPLLLQQLFQ